MVRVFYSNDTLMVHEIQDLLMENGIEAVIFDDESYRLSIPSSVAPSAVWILNNAKKVDALALISGFEDKYKSSDDIINNTTQDPSWICGACGEENDGNFYICWNCGKNVDKDA